MKINIRKPLMVVLSAVLAVSGLSAAAAAGNDATASGQPYRIVALGDSITVGYEPKMDLKSVPYGYVDRLYDQALFHGRSELANYGIMGLTTSGLTNLLQGAADGKPLQSADLQDFSSFLPDVAQQADTVAKQTRQLSSDLAQANLVVMTIGANDFGGIIKAAKDQPTESARKIIQDTSTETMNKYTEDLDKVMSQLHKLAPEAQIVLADQYLPLMKTHELYKDLWQVAQTLSTSLDTFATTENNKGIPVKIVHVSALFEGKQSSYTHFNLMEEFDTHPTQAGYEVIAKAFADTVWKDYRKLAPREANVPLSIVINGKEPSNKPTVKNNTTFLALTDVAEAVGAKVQWIQKTKTAVFSKDGKEVVIQVGAKSIVVNGTTQPLTTPAYFQQVGKTQKTYVPLAVISAGLDYQVVFRKNLLAAFINS